MNPVYDFHYDSDEDCFIITNGAGGEVMRTKSPHTQHGKTLIEGVVAALNSGDLIFPESKTHET